MWSVFRLWTVKQCCYAEEEEINDREIDEERNEDIDDERVDEEFYEVMYTCDGNLCINACAKSVF